MLQHYNNINNIKKQVHQFEITQKRIIYTIKTA